ncbi:MAG: hypothetical protein C4533_02915 [Candidatus Omnitrophota bacterium]|jgi:hypothetical protein|nr:MAG: hypothetical protein C4533_02915 [Candidatus Omnitrophota bacterium]
MSKTIDLLNQISKSRYTQGLSKVTNELKIGSARNNIVSNRKSRIPLTWMLGMGVATIILLNFIFTMKLFFIVKNYSSNSAEVIVKLNEIDKISQKNTQKLEKYSSDVSKISSVIGVVDTKIKDSNLRIAELQKQLESQKFAIENLTKAKDTLFNKVSELEAGTTKAKNRR